VGPRNHVLDGVQVPKGERAILGVVRFILKHCESLLRCMQQNSITASGRLLQPSVLFSTGRCHVNFPRDKSSPYDAASRQNHWPLATYHIIIQALNLFYCIAFYYFIIIFKVYACLIYLYKLVRILINGDAQGRLMSCSNDLGYKPELSRFAFAHHRVALPGARLPVSEHTDIVSFERVLQHLQPDVLVHTTLTGELRLARLTTNHTKSPFIARYALGKLSLSSIRGR